MNNIIIPGPYPREKREPLRQKEFTDLVGGDHGAGKSLQEIRATTKKEPRPKNYIAHRQLPEWEPAETMLSRDEFIRRVEPMHDRILVQLVDEPPVGRIVLTDRKQLISGDVRKAVVLKTGPGRWVEGEWWKVKVHQRMKLPAESDDMFGFEWRWYKGYRRPVSVLPGQLVLIGNWVDLELEDIALCQEMDVRSIVN